MSVTFSPPPAGRVRRRTMGLAIASAAAMVGIGVFAFVSRPGPETGELYFTTFAYQALYKVDFHFSGGRPVFGARELVAKLPAADGVAFEPNGDALVGGQGTGNVEEIDPATGSVRQVPSGCLNAYLIALSPSAGTAYTASLPGDLCALPTDPLRPGRMVPLSGDDTAVTDLAFDQSGQGFYTTGVIPGTGNFGLINTSTGATTRVLSGIPAGHGMAFDPYTKTLFLFGGDYIDQVDPLHPQTVISSMMVPSVQFDNGTTDGHGHLFVASNFGQLLVVDYHLSGRLGDSRNVVTEVHLHNYLDDVAPLVGPGVAPGSRHWIVPALIALGALLVLSLGYRFLPRPRLVSRLPSWDIRRQEAERRRRAARRIREQNAAMGRNLRPGGRRRGGSPPPGR